MRLGFWPERADDRNDTGSPGSDSGSAGFSPLMASSNSARSSTLRAIGPCTVRLRSILAIGVRATRPTLGRRPTTPQKLAGLRSEPAHVGAMRQPRGAGRQRRGGAARGAGGGSRQVPRVQRRAEHLVEGVGAGTEFRGVGFGVDHAALALEMFDRHIGMRRHMIPVDRRALRRQHARDIVEILDRHRQGPRAGRARRAAFSSAPWRGFARDRSRASAGRSLCRQLRRCALPARRADRAA